MIRFASALLAGLFLAGAAAAEPSPSASAAATPGLISDARTPEGVSVITAQRFRTQERNREDALARLAELVAKAAVRPIKRRPTRPTYASTQRRLEGKTKRAGIKAGRSKRE